MDKDIIFVDCFNTIICRNASPKQVLFDWAKKVGDEFFIEPAVIYKLYKKYEAKTYIKNKLKTGEGEYLFVDILAKMATILKNNIAELNVDNFKSTALDLYILAEQQSHYLNNDVVEELNQYKKDGKKIFVVSDFYCGKEVLKIWLKNLGVLDLFDDIFVSCDVKKSKRTGKLYKYLIKNNNFNKKHILMIGDNKHSDYNMAKMAHISAKKINSKNKKLDKNLKIKIKKGVNYCQFQQIFEEYGKNYNYSNYAFPFYLYYKRLYEQLSKNSVKNVLFMSREGQFMKKLFDEFCQANNYQINSHYFYVSRNSVLVASLKPLKQETFAIMLRSISTMNIKRFLHTLNFSKDEIEAIASELNVDINKASRNFTKSKQFKALLQSKTFVELYEQKRTQQRYNLGVYLKSFGIDFAKEGMHLVDVGWFGTIQDYLAKYFDGSVQTTGYYVGTFDKRKMPFSKKIGLFFAKPNNGVYGNKILRHRRMDYEQLYRADHNRVKGYKVANGKMEIIFGDEQDENKIFNELILPLQEQIYNKFVKICRLDYRHMSTIEPVVLKMFYQMICKQSKYDFEWLRNAENCTHDNFARIGLVFTKFKDGLRMFAYKALDFIFKVRFGLTIKCLKYVKIKNK